MNFNSHFQLSNQPNNKKYSHISYKKRLNLIDQVIYQGISIRKASVNLKIKYQTAKIILKNYRKEGRIFKRKKQIVQQQEVFQENRQQERPQLQPMTFLQKYPLLAFSFMPYYYFTN